MKKIALYLIVSPIMGMTACTEQVPTPQTEFIEARTDSLEPKASDYSIVGDGPLIVIPEVQDADHLIPINEEDL